MFNDMTIVTTAVSSFNNAALYSPYFIVAGLFSLPLFFMVFLYGQNFISKFGITNRDFEDKIGLLSVVSLVIWLFLFGGNYAVIRDGISWLPLSIATILFVSCAYIINRVKKHKYLEKIHNKKLRWFLFLLVLILAGFSAKPTLWGVLLQLSAVVCGIIVGDRFHKEFSGVFMPILVFLFMTVLLLMQPEYFRFGQLGNLTFIHVLALLLCGFFCVTTLATRYVKAKSKIYNSAYIKLKWLFRIMSLLALILFVLTESVPVFVGLMLCCMMNEMLTIYHSKNFPEHVFKQSLACVLICFGIMIICPLITMLGVVYLLSLPNKIKIKDFTGLL